ncbi:ABC transporter permease [Bacillus megaterium]|uniref:ABC transporter permease n=1 Tax=Priestia megaterium TaxID=1404 RepID=UPI001292E0D5|nr:ABC transporter permease [Priestia megaterium]MQR89642.1 ABC transporter permease [Priestia megaterium]
MGALIRYHFITYIKSYRYIPPLALYIISLCMNYTYRPNPVLDSFFNTALFLFFLTTWFTMSLFHAEDSSQEVITKLHVGKKNKYFMSKLISCMLLFTLLSAVSIAYPVLLDMFEVDISTKQMVFGFIIHWTFSLLGMSIGLVFTRDVVREGSLSWFGPLFILIVTLAAAGVSFPYQGGGLLLYVLPPVSAIIQFINEGLNKFLVFGWALLYAIALISLYLWRANRRDI